MKKTSIGRKGRESDDTGKIEASPFDDWLEKPKVGQEDALNESDL